MIVRFFLGLYFALCLVRLVSKAEVTVRDKAYHNLLVSFSPNLAAENGTLLLDSIQDLVENTSQVLHQAIGIRIASVIFRLPLSWDTSSWNTLNIKPVSISQTVDSADIQIDAINDSAFGKKPFALQFGGCGIPGQHISLPVNFLDQYDHYPKGKLLAREWLKYRYGVFDENGFPGDPMYPVHYQIHGSLDTRITECTHPEVKYFFSDANGDNCSLENSGASDTKCLIHPEAESADNATSSLMYFHPELSKVEQICGLDAIPHNYFSPSKHNLLCGEKSVWDVLKLSPDFGSTGSPSEYKSPQFSYVQEYYPRISVVWENTEKLFERAQVVNFAVMRLLYDLPEQSKYALYDFKENWRKVRSLIDVGDRNDVDLDSSFIGVVEKPCAICAAEQAVDELLEHNREQQGSIILIVGSNPTADSAGLANKLRNSRLCLTVVAFIEEGVTTDGFEALISASPCNSLVVIPTKENNDTSFHKLYQAMQDAVPQVDADRRITTVYTGMMSHATDISILVDGTADKYTIWLPESRSSESILCQKDGNTNVVVTRVISKPKIASYSLNAQNREVKCKASSGKLLPIIAQVQMTSKPWQYFVENVWIHDFTQDSDANQMPVIIYASIYFGMYPVRDAVVMASVTDPKGNTEKFSLYDNGRGDPDITWQDGIYSGYYMEFSDSGTYMVTVTFHEDHTNTRMGKNGADHCCGSVVKSEAHAVPSFKRTFHTSFPAKSRKPENGYKPSRILDLRVDKFDPPNSITLKWTAPGEQMERGKAKSYTLKMFISREDAITNFEKSGSDINITFTPSAHGIPEIMTIDLDDQFENNITYYLSIRATSDRDLPGIVSNVLEFFLPEDTRTTTPIDEASTVIDKITDDKHSNMSNKAIGISIGVIVAVIVVIVCIYLAVYFICRKRGSKEETENKSSDNSTKNNNPSRSNAAAIGLNSIPADVILKHHNEVLNAKSQHKDPPIFTEDKLDSVISTPNLSEGDDGDDNKNGPEYSVVQKRGTRRWLPQEDPPKSPKRMTPV